MNPAIAFPPPGPTLKLARPASEKWAATLTEERRRLFEDQQALRERETNLREYEKRLRALQAEIEAGRNGGVVPASGQTVVPVINRPTTRPVVADGAALQAAWEKLHRAREILEAEQSHLRDDRLTHRAREADLKQREMAIARREAEMARREELMVAAASQPIASEHTMGAITRLTRAPFDLARSVFGRKE